MTIKAIYGNFLTGAISENNVLPLAATGNSFSTDINAQDRLTLTVDKNKLPGTDWNSILSEASTLIALVDDSKAWDDPDAVLGGGMLNKISGKVGESIVLQVMGLREYLAAVICNPALTGTYTNPNSGAIFGGSTWRAVFADAIKYASSIPRLPAMFGPIDGVGEIQDADPVIARPVMFSDGTIFADLLDSLRDSESFRGNEYLFPLRWTSSSKNKMHFPSIIGSDTNPQINFENTLTIPLSTTSAFKSLEFSLSISTERMANRVIAQSKLGDTTTGTGSDLTSFSVDNGKPLLDTWLNTGVELATVDELAVHANARLADLQTPKGSATYSVIGEPGEWIRHKGKKIVFQGQAGTEAEGYSITVRMTGLTFSPESKIMKLDLMLPAARYPRLPSDTSKKKEAANTVQNGTPGAGKIGGTTPKPNDKPKDYVPISGVVEPPKQTGPTVDSNDYMKNKLAFGGFGFALAISSEGKLYSWGANIYAQLGNGRTDGQGVRYPVAVNDDTDWVACWASYANGYAMKADGSLWAWGWNAAGSTGTSTPYAEYVYVPKNTGMNDIKSIFLRDYAIFVIKKDGTLWTAGNPEIADSPAAYSEGFQKIGTKTDWVKVDARLTQDINGNSSVTRLDAAGKLWDNTGAVIDSPVLFKDFQMLSAGVMNEEQEAAWYMGLAMDNTLYSWGAGYHDGQMAVTRNAPEPYTLIDNVYGFLPLVNPFAKLRFYCFVVKNDGTLWAIGDATHDNGLGVKPAVFQLAAESGLNWKEDIFIRSAQSSGGNAQVGGLIIITRAGELGAIGRGAWGQNGYDTTFQDLTKPVVEAGWQRAAITVSSSLAVMNSQMYVTGYNDYGQLGTGDTTPQPNWMEQPAPPANP